VRHAAAAAGTTPPDRRLEIQGANLLLLNVYWHDSFPEPWATPPPALIEAHPWRSDEACFANAVGILVTREDTAHVSELSFDRHGDHIGEPGCGELLAMHAVRRYLERRTLANESRRRDSLALTCPVHNVERNEGCMSQRNGDRSRFQINRKRKLRHRERVRALVIALHKRDAVTSPDQQHPGAKVTKHA